MTMHAYCYNGKIIINKYACILLSCTFHEINSQVECAPLFGLDWPYLVGLGLGVAKEIKEEKN